MTNLPVQVGERNITGNDKRHYRAAQLDVDAELATLTPNTQRAYGRALRQFGDFCAGQGWHDPMVTLLRRSVLSAWESDMRQRGLATQTIRQSLAAVRWAAALAADADQVDEAELARMRRIKVHGSGVRQGVWLDRDDLLRLVRAPRGADVRSLRDRAMLALVAGCGLRRAELCALQLRQVDERDGAPVALVNLVGKGSKMRSVAIPEWTRPHLAAWLRSYRASCDLVPGDPLVCEIAGGGHGTPTGRPIHPGTFYRVLRQACATAGLPDIAPHDLRRTTAKMMQDGGASLDAIRDALGHRSTATTERYLKTAQGPALGTLAMDRIMR